MITSKKFQLLMFASLTLMLNLLASCGFQLRGVGVLPKNLELVTLDCQPTDAQRLCEVIRRQLAAINIRVAEEDSDDLSAPPDNQLVIASLEDKRRAASIASDASAAEIEFSRSVDFNFRSVKLGEQTLEMTAKQFQTYQYTELSVLGKEKEEQQVKDNLNQRLANEILNRLASAIALAEEDNL